MRRHRNNIKNDMAYFNKARENMNRKEKNKQTKIEKNEISIEERLICNDFIDNFDLEKEFTDCNLLGWIDMIENPNLYTAVKSLSIENQIFLSYIIKEGLTQRELAKIYGINQRTVGRKFDKILGLLKIILSIK